MRQTIFVFVLLSPTSGKLIKGSSQDPVGLAIRLIAIIRKIHT
nr:MAG TPA: hypothetical protein [Bacteriophage sp.]